MNTLSRKQREIQEREERVLEVACKMLVEQGYHGLSMDRIAETLEYSKGTIYQHFPNKEEILLALANQAMECRLRLFRRAAAFAARSRERMSAIGFAAELFVQLYPHHFQVEQVIRLSSAWEKTSEQRRRHLETCEGQCMGVVSGIIRDAVAHRDVDLPAGLAPEQIAFGLWSLTFGGYSIAATSPSLEAVGIREPFAVVRQNCNFLLDGVGWRPLSSEIDYAGLGERIGREVFAEELQAVAG
jgi:AcrR family transcriptional regulator